MIGMLGRAHLHEDKGTTQEESNSTKTFLDEHASADATHGTKAQLVQVQHTLCGRSLSRSGGVPAARGRPRGGESGRVALRRGMDRREARECEDG